MAGKEVFSKDGQQHDTSVSCCCPFAVLTGQVNFPDEVIVDINLLYSVSAGFIRGVYHDLVNKLPEHGWCQFSRLRVLAYNLQEALDVDRLRFACMALESSEILIFKSLCSFS